MYWRRLGAQTTSSRGNAGTALLDANRGVPEHGMRALLEKEALDEAAIRALTLELRRA